MTENKNFAIYTSIIYKATCYQCQPQALNSKHKPGTMATVTMATE